MPNYCKFLLHFGDCICIAGTPEEREATGVDFSDGMETMMEATI